MLARLPAQFAKLLGAGAVELPPLGGGGGRGARRRSKQQTLRGVTFPPHSQSGGVATRTPKCFARNHFFFSVFAKYSRICACVSGAAQIASISSTDATAICDASRRYGSRSCRFVMRNVSRGTDIN